MVNRGPHRDAYINDAGIDPEFDQHRRKKSTPRDAANTGKPFSNNTVDTPNAGGGQ
jgi:hypothetical protein